MFQPFLVFDHRAAAVFFASARRGSFVVTFFGDPLLTGEFQN